MKKALVVTHGYFGDIIFSTTCAEGLKRQYGFREVDYLIGFPQVHSLIKDNPHIDSIFWSNVGPRPSYDHFALESEYEIFQLQPMKFEVPPPIQMQMDCGLRGDLSSEYKVYTDPDLVQEYRNWFKEVSKGKPVVTWGNDLYDRAFEFTEEEYEKAVDVPFKGYGGRLRDVDYMISELSRWFHVVEVGAKHSKQTDLVPRGDDLTLEQTAAIMAASDMYFGIEGGLINIAAGVGTPTIMLPEFIHQLYGPKGVIRQIKEPKLGPQYYFEEGHHVLPLYKNTDELVDLTRKYIFNFLR